ncbi:MAG: hypothetical protein AAFX65_08595 [Cyanobacteria bacterium J06638_7]
MSPADVAVGLRRRPAPLLVLVGAGLVSVGAMGTAPHEAFQLPLAAVLAALLPLQLAALFYALRGSYRG